MAYKTQRMEWSKKAIANDHFLLLNGRIKKSYAVRIRTMKLPLYFHQSETDFVSF